MSQMLPGTVWLQRWSHLAITALLLASKKVSGSIHVPLGPCFCIGACLSIAIEVNIIFVAFSPQIM